MTAKNSTTICAALMGIKAAITRADIVERTGLTSQQVGGSLHNLCKTGAVIKHPGATLRTTGYTLDPEAAERMEPKGAPKVEKRRRYTKRRHELKVNVQPMPTATERFTKRALALYAADKHQTGGNALAQAHVATTLELLEALIGMDTEDPMHGDRDNLLDIALACHREAVEIMQQESRHA